MNTQQVLRKIGRQVEEKMRAERETTEIVNLVVDGIPHKVEFSLGGKQAFVVFKYPDKFQHGIEIQRETPEATLAAVEDEIRQHRASNPSSPR